MNSEWDIAPPTPLETRIVGLVARVMPSFVHAQLSLNGATSTLQQLFEGIMLLPSQQLAPYLLAEAAERGKLDEEVDAIISTNFPFNKGKADPVPGPDQLKTLAEWVYDDAECCDDIVKHWSNPDHKMGPFEEALMALILERQKKQ